MNEVDWTKRLTSMSVTLPMILHNAIAWNLLGVLMHQKGDHRRSVELIRQAIALDQSKAAFHANLAEAYRALNLFEQAADCCHAALRLDPSSSGAANNLGLALMAMGRAEEAITQFQAALRIHPGFALAHNNLGMSLARGSD